MSGMHRYVVTSGSRSSMSRDEDVLFVAVADTQQNPTRQDRAWYDASMMHAPGKIVVLCEQMETPLGKQLLKEHVRSWCRLSGISEQDVYWEALA